MPCAGHIVFTTVAGQGWLAGQIALSGCIAGCTKFRMENQVSQHMVSRRHKLRLRARPVNFDHNSYTTADQQSGRKGDFSVSDVPIHVTAPRRSGDRTLPRQLDSGHRAVLVTRQRGLTVAEARAKNVNLADRIDIFEIEQFIGLNFYELGKFVIVGRRVALTEFVTRNNEIIDEVETDPA